MTDPTTPPKKSRPLTEEEIGRAFSDAHAAVQRAIKAGTLPPASAVACAVGGNCTNKRVWHHGSYIRSEWTNVTCLCIRHHKEWHRLNVAEIARPLPSCSYKKCYAQASLSHGVWRCADHPMPPPRAPEWRTSRAKWVIMWDGMTMVGSGAPYVEYRFGRARIGTWGRMGPDEYAETFDELRTAMQRAYNFFMRSGKR